MLGRLLIAVCIAAPTMAYAEQPAQQDAQYLVGALKNTVLKLTGEALDWQSLALERQAKIDDLTKQLDAATKKAPAKGSGQ